MKNWAVISKLTLFQIKFKYQKNKEKNYYLLSVKFPMR